MSKFKILISGIIAIILVIATVILIPKDKPIPSNDSHEDGTLPENYCAEHSMPENKCFFCNPSLREDGRLWCAEHKRYEDRCFICHPELKEEGRLWCSEHLLYEDECFICHPDILDSGSDESHQENNSRSSDNLQCAEHTVPESECGICHPDLIADLESGESLKIRFESAQSANRAGVVTAKPKSSFDTSELSFLGKVTYNHNRLARVAPLASGVIQKIFVELGESVKKNQILVEISSPEIARSKGAFLTAISDEVVKKQRFLRERELYNKDITSLQDFEQAQANIQMAVNTTETARQTLINYGLSIEDIVSIEQNYSFSSLLSIKSPFNGTLIERNAVIGESVGIGDRLFSVANLKTMWLDLTVPEYQINLVETWSTIEAHIDVLPGMQFNGIIEWISPSIDEDTRTLKVRAIIDNSNLKLKHGMFGHINIINPEIKHGISVPSEALQWIDGDYFLFNKLEDDLYEIRKVTIGNITGDFALITSGVSESDEIVVDGSYVLKSEFLKSRLGAGCVDD